MVRVLWDRDEAIIMLAALIDSRSGKINRREAIEQVSKELRERAVKRGIEIDDKFRNENGIALQISHMENILTNGNEGLKKDSPSKLFTDVVAIYEKDPTEFYKLLKEAKGLSRAKTIKEQFFEWLASKASPAQLSELYIVCDDLTRVCTEYQLRGAKAFENGDISDAEALCQNVLYYTNARVIIQGKMKGQIGKIQTLMQYYCTFLRENPELVKALSCNLDSTKTETAGAKAQDDAACTDNKNKTKNTVQELESAKAPPEPKHSVASDNFCTVTFNNVDVLCENHNLAPTGYSTSESEYHSITGWKELYAHIVTRLYNNFPNELLKHNNSNITGWGHYDQKYDFADSSSKAGLKKPLQIAKDFYTETEYTNKEIVKKIRRLLSICGIAEDKLKIYAGGSIESETDTAKAAADDTAPADISGSSESMQATSDSEVEVALAEPAAEMLTESFEAKEPTQLQTPKDNFITGSSATEEPEKLSLTNATINVEAYQSATLSTDDFIVDFGSIDDMSHTKPVSFSYFGETSYVGSWKQLYAQAMTKLLDDYPDIIKHLLYRNIEGQGKYDFVDASGITQLEKPKRIADDFYLETGLGVSAIIEKLKRLLDICNVDYENLVIRYELRNAQSAQSQTVQYSNKIAEEVSELASIESNSLEPDANSMVQAIATENVMNDFIVDYENLKNLAFTRPLCFFYRANPAVLADTWAGLYAKVTAQLLEDYPNILRKYINRNFNGKGRVDLGDKNSSSIMTLGKQVTDELYLETNLSTVAIVSKICKLLDICGIEPKDLVIHYYKKDAAPPDINSLVQTTGLHASEQKSDAANEQSAASNSSTNDQEISRDKLTSNAVVPAPAASADPTPEPKQESKVQIERKRFIQWMIETGLASTTASGYVSSLWRCDKAAQDYGLTHTSLYLLDGVPELNKVKRMLFAFPEFAEQNKKYHNSLSAAFGNYLFFRMECKLDGSGVEPKVAPLDAPKPEPSSKEKERQTIQTIAQAKPEPALPVQDSAEEKLYTRCAEILAKYFADGGYQPERAINYGRMKRYYAEEYGCELDETIEAIDQIMRHVGTTLDGRIFPKQDSAQSNLLAEIVDAIAKALDSGVSAVYVDAVYERWSDRLADELQIYRADALDSPVENAAKGRFLHRNTYRMSFFIKEGQSPDSAADLERIMQEFAEPKNYDEIHDTAWYTTLDQIKRLLAISKTCVNVARNTYFYAPNLPISTNELDRLSEAMRNEINDHGHITESRLMELFEVNCPAAAIDTANFTSYGLRNCLSYFLQDSFAFNGPVVSSLGAEINLSDVFTEFAHEHETLQLEELEQLAKSVNANIYFDDVLREMVRVSQNEFVRRDLVDFDVERIDAALSNMCPNDYMPLKDVNLFLALPVVGYPWSSYLVESYLYTASRKFRLLHGNFAKNNVTGAMVKAGSEIKDYRSLLVDALSRSDALGSTTAALQYIVRCGYQNRQRYDGIEEVIKEAKLLKEQREKQEK